MINNISLSYIKGFDYITYSHTKRVTQMALRFSKYLDLTKREKRALFYGSLFHDVGKIFIPQSILYKPGELTENEYRSIKQHPLYGHKIMKENVDQDILDIILYHHEREDGAGYPLGVKGKQIPKLAKIVTLIDSYDAMISDRPYQEAMLPSIAQEKIKEGLGCQFSTEYGLKFLDFLSLENSKTQTL